MITYATYKTELEQIETALKQAIKESEKIKEKFLSSADPGDMKDRAFLFVLDVNIKNNRDALINFLKLPLF